MCEVLVVWATSGFSANFLEQSGIVLLAAVASLHVFKVKIKYDCCIFSMQRNIFLLSTFIIIKVANGCWENFNFHTLFLCKCSQQ